MGRSGVPPPCSLFPGGGAWLLKRGSPQLEKAGFATAKGR